MKPVTVLLYLFLAESAVMALAAYRRFAIDKAAAADGRRRVPEALLLFVTAAGGAPGAILAMHDLHHKTNGRTKWHFTVTAAASLLLQTAILGVLLFLSLTAG